MRIEYINKVTGRSGIKELPRKLNPVRVGCHSDNHLKLDSPYVGGEAGVFENDVAGGEGWRFWNRNGKVIRVGDTVLSERDQYALIRSQRIVIECYPYLLTAIFDSEEMECRTVDAERLDQSCAELVREVHQAVVELHPNDSSDRADWLKDDYLLTLEQQIMERAGARPDFPTDDLTQTALGDHLAGVAVRSALFHRLFDGSGVIVERFQAPEEASAWGRQRTALPEFEEELNRLAEGARVALGLRSVTDLSEQTRKVVDGFWTYWNDLLDGRSAPPVRLRRYLALRRLIKEIKDIWYGFGPLEDLLEDPTVTEIMVLDADHIFIEKNGQIESSGRRFLTDPLTIVQRIVGRANRQVNTSQPMVDARMPDGSRVNAVIPPLALRGPCLTIRRFPRQRLTMPDLIARRSLSPSAGEFLRAAVVNRRNVVVAGGTGTGKTTMLNCLSGFIPDKERIVTIEDTAELQLQKQHVVTLQGRQSNQEGAGSVTIRDLVRNALRMRPDRVVVGECRGGEAIDMLQAMNTGHDGSMTTLHANAPDGVIRRLEVLVQQNADTRLPVESIHQQVASAVDLIVQLGVVVENGVKRKAVVDITEVVGMDEEGGVRLVPLYHRVGAGTELTPTGHLPSFLPDLLRAGLVAVPLAFVRGT